MDTAFPAHQTQTTEVRRERKTSSTQTSQCLSPSTNLFPHNNTKFPTMARLAITSAMRRKHKPSITNHNQNTTVYYYVNRNRVKELWNGCCGVLLLIVGLLLGHYHGRYYHTDDFAFVSQTSLSQNLLSTSLLLPKDCSNWNFTSIESTGTNRKENDGWSQINVFYGHTDYVESKLNSSQKWFAQGRQDEAVLALLQHATDGQSNDIPIFVDLAANDATSLSNTYALERFHGWNGLCIEPNPMYWYNLSHYRPNCTIVGAVVGGDPTQPEQAQSPSKLPKRQQVPFRYDAGDHGGISGTGFDNGPQWKRQSIMEYTVKLEDIFERYHLPPVIDYVSIDVEGSEEWIFMNFPFKNYKFRCFTIERAGKRPNLVKRLEEFGYRSLIRLTRWGDSLWAHQDTIRGLSQDQLSRLLDPFDAAKFRRQRHQNIQPQVTQQPL